MCSLIIFDELLNCQQRSSFLQEGQPTLQLFLQPPPLSSVGLGGLHFHDHSKDTDGLPPVEKSPTNCTFAFLCKFGSAWNSRVTKVSTSLAVEAETYVRPLMTVSTGFWPASCAALVVAVDWGAFRMTKVKLNVSSSSLLSLRIKFGDVAKGEGSGSWQIVFSAQVLWRKGISP